MMRGVVCNGAGGTEVEDILYSIVLVSEVIIITMAIIDRSYKWPPCHNQLLGRVKWCLRCGGLRMMYTNRNKNKNTTINFKPNTSTKSLTPPTATSETQVAYSAVNRADTLQRAGKYPVPPGSPQVPVPLPRYLGWGLKDTLYMLLFFNLSFRFQVC